MGKTTKQIGGTGGQSIDADGIRKISFPDNGQFRLLPAHKPNPFRLFAPAEITVIRLLQG